MTAAKTSSVSDAEFLQANSNASSDGAVADLYRDNLLHVQCDELLEECKLSSKTIQAAQQHVELVAKQIDNLLSGGLSPLLSNIGFGTSPQPMMLNATANAHVLPTFVVTVIMSNNLFATNDYKRKKYFEERNALVEKVAVHLRKRSVSIGEVKYRRQNPFKVSLHITPPPPSVPKKKSNRVRKSRYIVEVNFQMESLDWIPSLRLVPNRNNLAGASTIDSTKQLNILQQQQHTQELQRQSMRYTHALTEDSLHNLSTTLASSLPLNCENACLLLQIWCLQRGALRAHDGLDVTQLDAMLLHLFRSKAVNARMTPIQVCTAWFKLVVEWSSSSNGCSGGVRILTADGKTVQQTIHASALAKHYATTTRDSPLNKDDPKTLVELWRQQVSRKCVAAVLLDPSLRHNFLGQVGRSMWQTLQRQASYSLSRLQFSALFLCDARFWTRHDAFLRIPLSSVQRQSKNGAEYEVLASRLMSILERALGDRVLAVEFLSTGNGEKDDSDQIPTYDILPSEKKVMAVSPTGSGDIVLGVTINPDNCFRVVDRGPPQESPDLGAFLDLWGSKAELRRFQDGAIVHAVVWDKTDTSCVRYQNDDTWQAGIVERIIRHILQHHFLEDKKKSASPQFVLRHIVSTVDCVASAKKQHSNPLTAHRAVMKAFESLAEVLRKKSIQDIAVGTTAGEFKSKLGIPLSIDAVEPLSEALRYAALFPPLPHPLLGGTSQGQTKTSGAIESDPIEIQLRFGASSKWPTDLKAIGAAKTAMLVALANGIDGLRDKDFGSVQVTPSFADVCYRGFVFRVFVRSDPELRLLRRLREPSTDASNLLDSLTRTNVVRPRHHAMVHGVYTSHPSSSAAMRLAQRWLASHLLSDQVPTEAVELLIAHVYTDKTSILDPPGTATAGLTRWLRLLSTHDWIRQPLLVDPQGHLTDKDRHDIGKQFDKCRGKAHRNGPALFIISPCNHSHLADEDDSIPNHSTKSWTPSFTQQNPEQVVLSRAVKLAERTYSFLRKTAMSFNDKAWPGTFQESPESFASYSALLRVDPSFCLNVDASSTAPTESFKVGATNEANSTALESTYTRSMHILEKGPKELQQKLYRNLTKQNEGSILLEWQPVATVVQTLKDTLGKTALFMYNRLCPDVIGVVWRPHTPRPFSAVTCEYARPVSHDWKFDTMMTLNVNDALREIACITQDIVVDVKVFDTGLAIAPPRKRKLSVPLSKERQDQSSSASDIESD